METEEEIIHEYMSIGLEKINIPIWSLWVEWLYFAIKDKEQNVNVDK